MFNKQSRERARNVAVGYAVQKTINDIVESSDKVAALKIEALPGVYMALVLVIGRNLHDRYAKEFIDKALSGFMKDLASREIMIKGG